MAKKKIRPLGDILLEMEPLILEAVVDHNLQHGDLIYLLKGYLDVHCPGAKEEYKDGTSPTLNYGPND